MLELTNSSIVQVLNDSLARSYDGFTKDGKDVPAGITHPVDALVENIDTGRMQFVQLKISPSKAGDVIEKGNYTIKGLAGLRWYKFNNSKVVLTTKIDLAQNPFTLVK